MTPATRPDDSPARTNPPRLPGPPHDPRPERKSSIVGWIIALLVLGLLGWGGYYFMHRPAATEPAAGGGRGPGGGAGQGPVPVIAATVEKKDVPIYLDGIGTVQAFNTVTVNPRVDGEIKKIAFTEGQMVKAGELLAEIDDGPYRTAYDQAVAKKGQDEAQQINAQINMTREEDLFAKKAVSAQERDTQQALLKQLDATVKADAAAIASAKVQLDYTKITAPIAGRTGLRLVDQGNIVHAANQTGIVVLTQLQPISLVFTLPQQDLTSIHKEGDGQEFTVLAVDRDTKTTLDEGKLSVIDNQIDTTTGTIKLKATFPNEKMQLWPGQFANARLQLAVRKDATVVPASVVQRGPQGAFAFVIKEGDTVEIRPVKVGPIEQGSALIEEGLQVGERVVSDGQYKLQPGSHVKVGEPGAAPGGAGRGAGAGGGGRPGGAGGPGKPAK